MFDMTAQHADAAEVVMEPLHLLPGLPMLVR
jgi:hypothetical protein